MKILRCISGICADSVRRLTSNRRQTNNESLYSNPTNPTAFSLFEWKLCTRGKRFREPPLINRINRINRAVPVKTKNRMNYPFIITANTTDDKLPEKLHSSFPIVPRCDRTHQFILIPILVVFVQPKFKRLSHLISKTKIPLPLLLRNAFIYILAIRSVNCCCCCY